MFDIGFWELTLVGLIALLVLGPERLPGAIRTTAYWVRRARNVAATVRAEVERELALEETKAALRDQVPMGELKSLEQELRRPLAPEPPKAALKGEDDRTA
ncbi:sec-independent protein translocase protein TatB [Methylomarinovum caldicuralii]|uniref:Sec-independent protein translocase protein TatB n=1 Tax=Methylomarinovum caldicuralii TaxID=438856 RepID=A0AAU9C9V0_9GAMM|nr:Sec-independent protein translocase protein TatB [Methylomarinovum caldicuralii]BCX82356.1 sec-independent protein translocase protein TatB [Methylomarinovum caldicuralii]